MLYKITLHFPQPRSLYNQTSLVIQKSFASSLSNVTVNSTTGYGPRYPTRCGLRLLTHARTLSKVLESSWSQKVTKVTNQKRFSGASEAHLRRTAA